MDKNIIADDNVFRLVEPGAPSTAGEGVSADNNILAFPFHADDSGAVSAVHGIPRDRNIFALEGCGQTAQVGSDGTGHCAIGGQGLQSSEIGLQVSQLFLVFSQGLQVVFSKHLQLSISL